ncbi:uncharacterized mitochondrial protein AtMg00810-like [Beta vulgaris subsp. vulgaris]|uniref:uncharacterized mitochondrial protein AtMg00810-like n=1 Tax=Beta vulgaris subsp. vulgaris TaxID=3555 RepID=UPI00203671E7|nr:uncharacterized mitochondrial protein AtMg00810-like [Beta vulgaris subsp. vulgaris]
MLHQLDINNAFLHGHLEEHVYLKPPAGYEGVTAGKVCKLKKSLYGLKQASRCWNLELKKVLLGHDFKQCERDHSLFVRYKGHKCCIILVYVDDLLLTGDDEDSIAQMKLVLDGAFTIKDLGKLRYFLGIEVARNCKGTMINQRKYAIDIVKDAGMENCHAVTFPFPEGIKLSTDQGELLEDPEPYRRLIGKFLYLNLSRPDLSFSVQQLSQYLSSPRKPHFQAALHVVKYLKGTLNLGLFYPSETEHHLYGYSDADWGSCMHSGRSLTGYCVFLGSSLISWKTKKQKVVSKSSCEAELRSMSQTTSELAWVAGLFEDLGITVPTPVPLFCDNKSTEYIAHNAAFHE